LTPGQQLHGILDHLSELSDDLNGAAPRHLFLGVFDQAIEDLCEHGEVLGVKPEVVADEGKDVVAEGGTGTLLDCLDNRLDDEACLALLTFEQSPAERSNRVSADIFVIKVFCELVDDVRVVLLADKSLQDAHLHHLDEGGLPVGEQEAFKKGTECILAETHHQILDVLQDHVLHLRQVVVQEGKQTLPQG
jgi:hypothetical protein